MAKRRKHAPLTPKQLKRLKDDVVRMRISAEQKRALTVAAEREGLSFSAWLRQLALRAAGVLDDPQKQST